MRLKHRFLIAQVDFAGDAAASAGCSTVDLFSAIRTSLVEVFGDAGWAAAAGALAVKFYSPTTRLVLIRAPAACILNVRAAVALVRAVCKRPAALHVLQVAGSVRTLRTYLQHWHATILAQLRASAAADSTPLDDAFFASVDADMEEALQFKGREGGGAQEAER